MSNKLWGGRFSRGTAQEIERFSHSFHVDSRLARYDLLGSIAHARMLGKTGVIPKADSNRLVSTLIRMLKDLDRGRLMLDSSAEDVHTAIQMVLEKRAGAAGQRLHTARSRNDQVVTSFRLYGKDALARVNQSAQKLQQAILAQAQKAKALTMPGYTHLHHAQPVLIAHVLLSYLEALQRDRARLADTLSRMDELPLGSGALTGTGLKIDRAFIAKQLGFARVAANSVDAVTDRDFAAEILMNLSLLSIHLARIAEDLILWSTSEFGFLRFDESLLTGSSMMPQKQNPDFLELTRGGSSQVIGALQSMLVLLKGLSTGYQRDLQLDKEILFGALDQIEGMLSVTTLGFQGIHWNPAALARQLQDESLYATDLAEYLVGKGLPFAQAHRAVGQLLSHADKKQLSLRLIDLATYRKFSPLFDREVHRLIDPKVSVQRKRSQGSTNPAEVAKSIRRWKLVLRGKKG